MNDKKICFISSVNNEKEYEENLLYIKNLNIPEGYQIETIGIKDTKSVTSAYNTAMEMSDAKYKVYTQDNVLIINKDFIRDMLCIFEGNCNIGLMGLVGTKQLTVSTKLRESPDIVGKIYENNSNGIESLQFNEIQEQYQVVQTVEGVIIITQYDLLWREDLFLGNYFYDFAQSIEFKRAGFQVVVPNQKKPWIINESTLITMCHDSNCYEESRSSFIDEYYKDVFPLVSILIPAYNQTKYLKIALESAINQTYKNTEIVICDDSTTKDVKELIEEYMKVTDKIRYYNNGGPLGEYGKLNTEKCFSLAKGEYISFLYHDDEYYLTKIERMMEKFITDNSLTLVTSYRSFINENGEFLYLNGRPTFDVDTKLSGEEAARKLLFGIVNYIGEFTTVVFKKKDVLKNNSCLIGYYESNIRCLGDIALFIRLSTVGNVFYIKDKLSKFRVHSNQNSTDTSLTIWSIIDFLNIIIDSYERKLFIKSETELKISLEALKRFYPVSATEIIHAFNLIDRDNRELEQFLARLNKYKDVIVIN